MNFFLLAASHIACSYQKLLESWLQEESWYWLPLLLLWPHILSIFLMPLGGGVFNNTPELIAKSISLAVELLAPVDREKLSIKILTWNGNPKEALIFSSLLEAAHQ